MANLNCAALNCSNNSDGMCRLNEIEVCGSAACSSEGTCCASFTEMGGAFGNYVGDVEAEPETNIGCDVSTCRHYDCGVCCAPDVKVSGTRAHVKEATSCRTFEEV